LHDELSYEDVLLTNADVNNAVNTLPICPDSGTVWLFTDGGDSNRTKDYVYDGYRMNAFG
ncbi:unnamed protein product, partial [Didymodactylos carnosus]